jgi:hypothetical protein
MFFTETVQILVTISLERLDWVLSLNNIEQIATKEGQYQSLNRCIPAPNLSGGSSLILCALSMIGGRSRSSDPDHIHQRHRPVIPE